MKLKDEGKWYHRWFFTKAQVLILEGRQHDWFCNLLSAQRAVLNYERKLAWESAEKERKALIEERTKLSKEWSQWFNITLDPTQAYFRDEVVATVRLDRRIAARLGHDREVTQSVMRKLLEQVQQVRKQ